MTRTHPLLLAPMLLALAGCQRAQSAEPRPADTMGREDRRAMQGRIVFVSERGGNADVYTVDARGRRVAQLTKSASADYPAAISPDGRSVLVVAVSGEGQQQAERMAVVPLDGSAAKAIGPVSARVRSPSWSPDGRWIVFESDSASFRDLYRMNRDGSGLVRLTDNPEGNFEPVVSPDGRSIAFVSSRDGDSEVYVMRAGGGEPRRITAFHRDDWHPRWSPDGRMIALLSNRESIDRIFLVAPDGSGIRPLNARSDSTMEGEPAWSPDGQHVAYVVAAAGTGPNRPLPRLAVTDVRTGERRFLSAENESAAAPAWSPDGRYVAYTSTVNGEADIRVARADGRGVTTVVRAEGPDWLPRWIR